MRDKSPSTILLELVNSTNNTPDDRRVLLNKYRFVDFARKVAGVGSVGTRTWVMLFMSGSDGDDPLFLQLKEADASVLEPYLRKSKYSNHGERVVQGQRLMQEASGIFLGWTHGAVADLYVRQLRDVRLWSMCNIVRKAM